MRLVESNKVDNNIISNLLEEENEGRYFDVTVTFCGTIGVEHEYHVYAKNRIDAVNEVLDNPGSEAEQDLSVENIEDNGDGSYTATVNYAGYIGVDNDYTVYADSEEEAEMNAIEEAKADLEVLTVDGTEFSYDEAFECDKVKKEDKKDLKESVKSIKDIAASVENILKQCGASISYVDYREAIEDAKLYENNEISLSCEVKPDKISKTENEVGIYGTLVFDKDLNLVQAELRTGSGPNILNYSFIKCLNALYSYFSSGNNHYDL